jgi:Tol biopolymer transport system component
VWVDRAGRELFDIAGPADFFSTPRLSPDEQKVVIGQRTPKNGGADIWIFERGRKGGTRLTFEPGIETAPTWSPDGKRIVFSSAQKAAPQLWWKDITATGSGEAVSPGPFQLADDWSKDGRYILFHTSGGDSDSGIWIMPAGSGEAIPRKPVQLIQEHFPAIGGNFSPDGKWIAFVSSESGRFEVYVQAFQGGDSPRVYGERHRISTGGGIFPRWRGDGRELFFVSGDNRLMSAAIRFEPAFQAAEPAALFRLRSPIGILPTEISGFDVARDGQRFVVVVMDSANSPPLTVVVNWQAGLKK